MLHQLFCYPHIRQPSGPATPYLLISASQQIKQKKWPGHPKIAISQRYFENRKAWVGFDRTMKMISAAEMIAGDKGRLFLMNVLWDCIWGKENRWEMDKELFCFSLVRKNLRIAVLYFPEIWIGNI